MTYNFINVGVTLIFKFAPALLAFKYAVPADILLENVAKFAAPVNVTPYTSMLHAVPLCTAMTSAD
jgi:hypothetical protein